MSEIVQYIIVRTDLGMPKGKIAAQVGHGVHLALRLVDKKGSTDHVKWVEEWEVTSYAKIVLKAKNLEELLAVKDQLDKHWYFASVVVDEGRNHVEPNTVTVLGLQPMPKDVAAPFVGHLPLL
jgi:peptidyl-tRNA hydrolase, PTH2 family